MGESVKVIPIQCKMGPISAFAYYIDAPEPALIDTGIAASASREIETVLLEQGVRLEDIQWILLTHGHVDHLGGARAVWEKTGQRAQVVIPKTDAELLRNRDTHIEHYKQLQAKFVDPEIQEKHIANLLNDIGEGLEPTLEVVGGDQISLGEDISITVVETPGHSLGSVTFVVDELGWAFAADAVQMYGGELSGIPTIEFAEHYRNSVRHLLEVVRPKRLYLGHPFRNAKGEVIFPPIEGKEVISALQESLEMDAKLAEVVTKHLSGERTQLSSSDGLYGEFESIAEDIGYKGDPRNMPCAFFVTMNAYKEDMTRNKK